MIRLFQKSDLSRATESSIMVPCPDGLELAGYQRACVDYASRRKDCLIADAPGVGKTIEAIACLNFHSSRKILVVCPGFLKPNWRDEVLKWDTNKLSVGIMKGMKGELPETDVVIINYEILKPYRERLRQINWDFIIVDEAHKLKNKKADRTREVFGGIKRNSEKKIVDRVTPIPSERRLFLTGTPALNGKPKELWNLIQQLDPHGLGADWFYYAKRYCQLQELKFGNEHVGWKWDGCDNLAELQQIMRERFMIRRTKEEVLPFLPPKRRVVIPIESGERLRKQIDKELLEFEKWAQGREEVFLENPPLGDFSKKMLETGLSMVEPTVEIVENDLDEHNKIVVACYHNQVAREIAALFPGCILINGEISVDKRHPLVLQFQNDPGIKLLIGTVGSVGEGETLTAAKLMVLPERPWTVGAMTQMEDRIHRRGQKDSVLFKHLVREGSISERQVRILIRKQETQDKMLDE